MGAHSSSSSSIQDGRASASEGQDIEVRYQAPTRNRLETFPYSLLS